jgi:DNA ligase-1
MKLEELVRVSAAVAGTPGRLDKISKLAALFAALPPEDVPIAIGFLTGWPRQGRLGVGWATVASARDREAATTSTLELHDVDVAFDRLLSVGGKNSGSERARLIGDLFSRATIEEQHFLAALMIGEVRQGALEGVMLEAIAKAGGLKPESVRRGEDC